MVIFLGEIRFKRKIVNIKNVEFRDIVWFYGIEKLLEIVYD